MNGHGWGFGMSYARSICTTCPWARVNRSSLSAAHYEREHASPEELSLLAGAAQLLGEALAQAFKPECPHPIVIAACRPSRSAKTSGRLE